MAKGGLRLVGGTAAPNAEPPPEGIQDTPQQITVRALALNPIDIIIGVLDHEGCMHVLSSFSDEYMDLGALKKMEQALTTPDDDSA
jgi:hypothetical protein